MDKWQWQILVHLSIISSHKGDKSKKVTEHKKGKRDKKEIVNAAGATERTRNEKGYTDWQLKGQQ